MDYTRITEDNRIQFRIELVLLTMIDGVLSVYLNSGISQSVELQLPSSMIDVSSDCNLDHSVKRVVSSIAAGSAAYIEQVKTVGNATRRPGEWSVSTLYYSLVHTNKECSNRRNWYSLDFVSKKATIAYDQLALINSCCKRLRTKAQYTSLPMYFLPAEFTVYQLQQIYESLLASEVDNKSFRRRFLDAGLLIPLNKLRHGCNRPAQLYSTSPQHVIHHFSRKMLGSTKQLAE